MVCSSCGSAASRVRVWRGRERCPSCGGFAEAGGFRSDGVLSRERVRMDAAKHEGDVINPWRWNRDERAFEPNDEFVRLHADNARNFFAEGDLTRYPKLAKQVRAREEQAETAGEGELQPEFSRLRRELDANGKPV